jgi:hypothetical protein
VIAFRALPLWSFHHVLHSKWAVPRSAEPNLGSGASLADLAVSMHADCMAASIQSPSAPIPQHHDPFQTSHDDYIAIKVVLIGVVVRGCLTTRVADQGSHVSRYLARRYLKPGAGHNLPWNT